MASPSTNAVAQRKANLYAPSLLAKAPKSPKDVASPSFSKMEARATNVFPTRVTDGCIAAPRW